MPTPPLPTADCPSGWLAVRIYFFFKPPRIAKVRRKAGLMKVIACFPWSVINLGSPEGRHREQPDTADENFVCFLRVRTPPIGHPPTVNHWVAGSSPAGGAI